MKKIGLLLGVTAAMAIAAGSVVASHFAPLPEKDARVIVEVNRKLDNLDKEDVRETQDVVYNNIKKYATTNIKCIKRYNELNNAFVLEVNSEDIESIKAVPGVASVTVDTMHWTRVYNNDGYEALGDPDDSNDEQPLQLGESDNISAYTMHKPENTNDGEGTLIAILDNEFHLRGKYTENGVTYNEWHHEVYDPLPSGTKVKYTFTSISNDVSGLNALLRKSRTKAGEEGSEYLNNKVPFYFDYGGESSLYGKTGDPKYDVHSDLSYHGSHVSSITAANAPEYKGIAPKAQLALMKVFTDYNSKGMGEKLGLSTHSGAYDSVILSALEDCIKLDVDGINMSLGSDLDDFDSNSITLKTLTRLSEEGILTSISAGNSGKTAFSSTGAYSNWGTESVETGIMSSYANNKNAMTIASGHPVQIFYENAFYVNGNNVAFEDQVVNREGFDDDYEEEFRMKDLDKGQPLEWVYVPGFGTTADYGDLEVSGKIVVVNRGSTSFADKYSIAANKNAAGLVIINNDPTASSFNFRCSFGEGFTPTMPCALVLYKDRPLFEENKTGSLTLINKKVLDNPNKYTVSNFSTDGATFDLDLKPEITAPGDNIKGAVPEHAMTNLTKAEKESDEYKYKCYQYLSGTSMSAPNYAGAQAVVLSEKAPEHIDNVQEIKDLYYNDEVIDDDEFEQMMEEEKEDYIAYRETVDMRLMSTADPMKDVSENPETKVKTLTSPRIQGAGMVDLEGALNTKVYLEGLDLDLGIENAKKREGRAKSKIVLRNNPDIANGDIKLAFLAHNEGTEEKQYDVKLTVMRPALASPNDIVTGEYNYRGAIDDVARFSGVPYYDIDLKMMSVGSGDLAYKDVFKVSKDIEYYASEADYKSDTKSTIKMGFYYNAATEGCDWQDLPSYTAQSTMDVVIAEVTGQTVTIPAGESTVTINTYSLTDEQKQKILENYEYGCMIEGFVTLTDKAANGVDLSIPYLGFYSGTDKDADASYDTAPVSEPFNFEKDPTKVYPSDLVDDITKSLIGKDNVNYESMIVAGYAERPQKVNTDKVLTNDQSFDNLSGFYKVGTDPATGEYTADPSNDIYVGSPETTNTLIIQQFMLRSVADNYFSITKKDTNELVYQSALEDSLFGDTAGKWALYKSHVDAGYLSAGYVAHRAWAIVPLFDEQTNVPFESGEYQLTFNYQLAASGHWVSKAYTIHIDSDAPVVKSVTQYKDSDGTERVRVYFEEEKLAYGVIGYNRVSAKYDNEKGMYYLDETKQLVATSIAELAEEGNPRLYIGAVDFARGKTGCLVHATNYNYLLEGLTLVQGSGINPSLDFTYENGELKFFDDRGVQVQVDGKVILNGFPFTEKEPEQPATSDKGCNGSIAALGAIICIPSLMGAALLISKKRKGEEQL